MARRSDRVFANGIAAAVLTAAGLVGWAPLQAHPHPQDELEPGAAFARHALAMRGHPYRYGGERPGGFDCSGLVNYAASRIGLRVPRTTSELLQTGRRVDRSRLRPGDLVFFHQTGRKLLHVGIYIGDDYFVHAPSTGRVVSVDDLQNSYYRRHFWQARRIRFERDIPLVHRGGEFR